MFKPFGKIWGWVGAVGSLAGSVALAVKSGNWTLVLPALGSVLALLSHSATGTGGSPANP